MKKRRTRRWILLILIQKIVDDPDYDTLVDEEFAVDSDTSSSSIT